MIYATLNSWVCLNGRACRAKVSDNAIACPCDGCEASMKTRRLNLIGMFSDANLVCPEGIEPPTLSLEG